MEKKESKLTSGKKKAVKIAIQASVIALLIGGFTANVVWAVYSGGEFAEQEDDEYKITGLIKLSKEDYQTSYFDGDHFSFDKKKNVVSLVAKDPLIENLVKIDDLPGPEYGFVVRKEIPVESEVVEAPEQSANEEQTSDEVIEPVQPEVKVEESEFYLDASSIVMHEDMGDIYLVSKRYRNLEVKLDTEVMGTLDESKLSTSLVMEAENALIYQNDVLLSREDLKTKPASDKPFLSNEGTAPLTEDQAAGLSGNACLRNFQKLRMTVEFELVSVKEAMVDLVIDYCLRPSASQFGSWYEVTVNGTKYEEIDNQECPAGTGYYTPAKLSPVSIKVQRGVNRIVFKSGAHVNLSSPANLDAIELTASESIIADKSAII